MENKHEINGLQKIIRLIRKEIHYPSDNYLKSAIKNIELEIAYRKSFNAGQINFDKIMLKANYCDDCGNAILTETEVDALLETGIPFDYCICDK